MKVLWLCNTILPVIAERIGIQASNKEGWLSGLAARIREKENSDSMELCVCFPHSVPIHGRIEESDQQLGITYYGFTENSAQPEIYDGNASKQLYDIVREVEPDVIHVFGTEYAHTLMMAETAHKLGLDAHMIISLQGIMRIYTECYLAGLPERVAHRVTFRDWLKRDSIMQQQDKFRMRADFEERALKLAKNVTGRTTFDQNASLAVNANLKYYFMNETLRPCFYEGEWSRERCTPHTIFLSQGNYPIKGAHFAIQALARVREQYPDVSLRIAGDVVTGYTTLKDKIKISSYGKYLRELIAHNHLQENVTFVGKCNAEQMKKEYLNADLFLCPSAIENSPNSVGEAMILGTPVLSAHVGGIADMMIPDEEGLFYQWDDPAALADRILEVYGNREQTEARAAAAKRHAQITHSREQNYRRLLEIYTELSQNEIAEEAEQAEQAEEHPSDEQTKGE